MTDSPASPSDGQLPELSTPEPVTTPSNARRKRALWGALAAIAVAVGAVAVQSADDDPPRLPLALGAEGASKEAAASDMSMRANVVYVAGDDLPELGGEATAYRLRGQADRSAVQRIADALGLTGPPEQEGTVWRVTDGQHTLEVNPGMGSSWWYGDTSATKSSVAIDEGAAREGSSDRPAPAPDVADTYLCVPATTIPVVAKDLPTKAEARQIALDLLDATGMDTADAVVTIDGPYEGWYVNVEATIDGMPTGLYSSVTIGPKGAIQWASGTIAEAEKLDSYPIVDTGEAIDRLNEGYGGFAGANYGYGYAEDSVSTAEGSASVGPMETTTAPEPATTPAAEPAIDPAQPTTDTGCVTTGDTTSCASTGVECSPVTTIVGSEITPEEAASSCGGFGPYEPSEPVEIVLHDAKPVLMLVGATDGSNDGYLVPGYRFTGDDGVVVDQVALGDGALEPVGAPYPGAPTIEPDLPTDVVDPGTSGGGSPGYDPDGSVSSPVNNNPNPVVPDTTTPCTLPAPGPNGEVPMIGCAETTPVTG